MNQETLVAYRRVVEKGWTAKTAHPRFTGLNGRPMGQCGVTSAWLQKRLREDHGIEALYCVGEVSGPDGTMPHHCWLQHGRDVYDLTIDQRWPDMPFVGADLNYRGRWFMARPGLTVLERLELLEDNLLTAAIARHPAGKKLGRANG